MSNETYIGIACIVFGLFFTWWTIRYWKKGDDLLTGNARGLVAGIGSIIVGIMFVLGKIHL